MASALLRRLRGRTAAAKAAVVGAGHPALRRGTAPVQPTWLATTEGRDVVERLVASMRAHEGVGLAAPQLGLSHQVLQEYLEKESYRSLKAMRMEPLPLLAVANPRLRLGGTQAIHREGCLSIPYYSAHVPRFSHVELEGLNATTGEPLKLRLEGWAARIVQHEVDHLQGQMYVDRMLSETFADDRVRCQHPAAGLDVTNDHAAWECPPSSNK